MVIELSFRAASREAVVPLRGLTPGAPPPDMVATGCCKPRSLVLPVSGV
jgi:hypothetical protein